ncbi:uncharacterized protein LOC142786389 [Rhipicephalus microplus]|uniref:uncharacterized protein LOC142786389 n=1 Tax=Rhipicephalus microplus TaxID=6941 RepID=UPI003F6D4C9D
MTEPTSGTIEPGDVVHAGYAGRESADELRSTGASCRASSDAASERHEGHDEVVAVADKSHHNELGQSGEALVQVTLCHGGVRCSQGGVHGCESSREPPGVVFRTRNADSRTSECGDEVNAVPSNHVSQHVRATSRCSSDKSLPTEQSNAERTSSNSSTVDARCHGQLSKDWHSKLNPCKSTRTSSDNHASFSRDKKSALKLRDPTIMRNRINVLRNSASESRCECPARENSNSPNLRLIQGAFPASHLCTEAERRRPKYVLSAEECREARGMFEKDSTRRKRKLSSQAIPLEVKETLTASLALETPRHVTRDTVASKPKGVLSIILDTEDTKKASASFDDAGKAILAESPPDKSCSEMKSERAAGVSAIYQGNVSFEPVGESDARNDVNAKHDQAVHVDFPKANAGIPSTCAVKSGKSAKGLILRIHSIPSTTQNSATVSQFLRSPEQSKSLLLDFDAERRSASTQLAATASRQMCDKMAVSVIDASSSDSAQLSPQPELSFLLSDVLCGSADNTNMSWSAVNTLFRDKTALSLWGSALAAKDAITVATGTERAKGASVAGRPTSPETCDTRTPSPFGRAKRTVSCPLSFEAESVCYETGDQEAFEPRQSGSNCWCCEKNERALEHKQSSAHMPVDEYLRLKERLDQRPHTPALWESSKSDQSNLERDMDMATLDCSVAGFRQYSRVELFHHESSSSAKSRAVDSSEQWLNENVSKGDDKRADECCGTSTTLSFMEDYIVLSLGGDDSEIVIDDASYRESITGETTQEIDTLNEEAGNADDATPGPIPTSMDCWEPEAPDLSTKWPSPRNTEKATFQLREMETLSVEGENATTAVNGDLSLEKDVLAESYVNTRYSGIELAEVINEFATGLSLKDVVLIPRRQPCIGVMPVPRLDDVDFSEFVPDDALSVQESLAKMPKIICKGTLRK